MGAVFVLVGVLGFVPAATPDGKLLGLFDVSPLHNLIHLLSGVAAFVLAMMGEKNTRLYFQVFGVVYALITVIGFIQGSTVLGLIGVNMADNLLHLLLAVVLLYAGFAMKEKAMA